MPFTILVAPSGFKESLRVEDVAEAIAAGACRAAPGCRILSVPVFDGGDGFTEALVRAKGGSVHKVVVTGPIGEPVASHFGILKGRGPRTAVVELAAAAGLRLVPLDRRDPESTTSRGLGELIVAALDAGAERILIGCGDSGVQDGGAGMLQALGVRLLDRRGRDLPPGGGALRDLVTIDSSGRDPRIATTRFEACVNTQNMLLGEFGVSRIFGPQKGATPTQVANLERALANYAARIDQHFGGNVASVPGSGASGGAGAAIHAFLGALLRSRYGFISKFLPLHSYLEQADLVISAEGCVDRQTWRGKIPGELVLRARKRGVPVIVIAGSVGDGVDKAYAHGIDAFVSILNQPVRFEQAVDDARVLLEQCAENVVRIVGIGIGLASRRTRQGQRGGVRPAPHSNIELKSTAARLPAIGIKTPAQRRERKGRPAGRP